MSKRVISPTRSSGAAVAPRTIFAWWRQTGEPFALTGLALAACTLPVLVILELLSLRQGLRGMLALAWLAACLLLTRLPLLLGQERRRIWLIAGVGAIALGSLVLGGGSPAALAGAGGPNGAVRAPALTTQAAAGLTFKAGPRISRQAFATLLQRGVGGGPSPAAPYAGELYDVIAGYGLDPGVALAFFAHESQFCTTGVCANMDTKNWGAMRGAVNAQRVQDMVPGPFVRYRSWQDGVRDWCELILYRYVNRGLDTVEAAVPVYAPRSDGNAPTAYIDAIYRMVAVWQGRYPDVPSKWTLHTYADNLEDALMTETFLSSGVEYHPTWAFHSFMLAEARAGRSLGAPVDESRTIVVAGKKYAIQTFAFDTLYTPVSDVESQTNWSDVRRLSDLLKQQAAAPQPTAVPQPTTASQPAVAPVQQSGR